MSPISRTAYVLAIVAALTAPAWAAYVIVAAAFALDFLATLASQPPAPGQSDLAAALQQALDDDE